MHSVGARCHCGNIRAEASLPNAPATYRPRACDCDFCRKHAAAYVSDAGGTLNIHIADEHEARKYRQGSAQAEFLLCRRCGVLVAALFSHEGKLHGVVNARAADVREFGPEQGVSPQRLAPGEKAERWRNMWFPDVTLNTVAHAS